LGIILTGLGIVAVIYVFSLMPEQAQFVKRRFTNLETTGRAEIWLDALSMCLKRPFLGYGSGGSQILGSFHNAYLTAWYEGGLAGLILFGGAFVVMALRELKLVVQQKHEEILDLARLLLGLTLASIAAGFFESKLVSPSNIAIFTAIIVSVILTRLKSLLREYWFEPVPEEELPDDASYANDGYDSYS
jgi:O-antigen ligase